MRTSPNLMASFSPPILARCSVADSRRVSSFFSESLSVFPVADSSICIRSSSGGRLITSWPVPETVPTGVSAAAV